MYPSLELRPAATDKLSVSVIMSEFNTNPVHLKLSIESVLNQTYSDFEFLIIDDRGRNDLTAIANSYEDSRIKVVRNDRNIGLVESLNKAVRISSGDLLVRMDTDDIARPERIETLVGFALQHPEYSVIGSRVMEFSELGETGVLSQAGEKGKKSIMRGDVPVHPSVIMRKSDIVAVGGYPNFQRAEDLALWCEVLLGEKRIFVIKEVLLDYRVNSSDYTKRGLRYRKGEIAVRIKYYPKLRAGVLEYYRILKSIIAGILPTKIVRTYRTKSLRRKGMS